MDTPPCFSNNFFEGIHFCYFLSTKRSTLKIQNFLLKDKFFLKELTHTAKGSKTENDKVASPEEIQIHLYP